MVDIKRSPVHIVSEKTKQAEKVHLVLHKDAQEQGKHGWECKR